MAQFIFSFFCVCVNTYPLDIDLYYPVDSLILPLNNWVLVITPTDCPTKLFNEFNHIITNRSKSIDAWINACFDDDILL